MALFVFKLYNKNMDIYEHGDRNKNEVALTFDDGPNPFWTLKILDLLDEYNIKANFFVLGIWAEKYPEIIKETFDRGHLIGNHTYSHPRINCGDFEKAEEIIFKITGAHTKFIRAPYFESMFCQNYKPAINGDVKIIKSDVILFDWKFNSNQIIKLAKEKIQNGSIIVLHDGSDKEAEIENRPKKMFKSLPNIIEIIKGKNLKAVRLDELNYN